jgi:hypothetical protein
MNKKALSPIFKHYLFLVLIPAVLAAFLGYFGLSALPTVLIDFAVFVSPFVFFAVAHRRSIKNVKSNKLTFIIFSFIIPYLFTGYMCT